MITKTFEIRDVATFIPVLAIKLRPGDKNDRYLLGRAGYGVTPKAQGEFILLINLESLEAQYDPNKWASPRTMPAAHHWLLTAGHFDDWDSGSVIDVEYIKYEKSAPKESERLTTDWEA